MGMTKRAQVSAAIVALAAALSPTSLHAARGGEAVLEPTSPWAATYEDGRCRLSRMFSGPDGPHPLIFEQTAPGSKFRMAMAGSRVADMNAFRPARLSFGPEGTESDQDIAKERSAEFGAVVFLKDIDFAPSAPKADDQGADLRFTAMDTAIDTAAAAPLRSVSLVQGARKLTFKTGPLAAPLDVLNACTGHILETWGIDPEAQRSASRKATLQNDIKVARAIQERYPRQAVIEGRGGVVGVAVLVDQTGAPTECKITDDSGDRDMNGLGCEFLMKAKFDPALDADGKPIKSFWVTRITYRLG